MMKGTIVAQMGSGGPSGMWGSGFFWLLLWAVVLGLLVAGVIYLLTRGQESDGDGKEDGALANLRERYARGEVTEDEFEERRRRLRREE